MHKPSSYKDITLLMPSYIDALFPCLVTAHSLAQYNISELKTLLSFHGY